MKDIYHTGKIRNLKVTHSAVSQLLGRQDDGPALLPGYSAAKTHTAGVTRCGVTTPPQTPGLFVSPLHSSSFTQFEGFFLFQPCL